MCLLVYHGQKLKHNMDDMFKIDDELEVLKSFMPSALKEGSLLVEFKSEADSDFVSASVLTLNESEVVGSKPDQDQTVHGTWCFNVNKKQWVWLDYSKIGAVQPWPLEEVDTILNP